MNDDLAIFSSLWDIDQLVSDMTISVGSGATAVYTIPDPSNPPTYELQFQPTGSNIWYMEGLSSTDGTLASLFSFSSYIDSSQIYAVAAVAGTVRVFVWEDKINYD